MPQHIHHVESIAVGRAGWLRSEGLVPHEHERMNQLIRFPRLDGDTKISWCQVIRVQQYHLLFRKFRVPNFATAARVPGLTTAVCMYARAGPVAV